MGFDLWIGAPGILLRTKFDNATRVNSHLLVSFRRLHCWISICLHCCLRWLSLCLIELWGSRICNSLCEKDWVSDRTEMETCHTRDLIRRSAGKQAWALCQSSNNEWAWLDYTWKAEQSIDTIRSSACQEQSREWFIDHVSHLHLCDL